MGDEYLSTILEMKSDEDIDYVKASPPDSELVSLEEVQDDILHEKLLNIYLLIVKIESLNNNPTPDCMLKSHSSSFISYTDNSSPEFDTFSYNMEETSSGSTTTHANNSLPEYDLFLFVSKPDQDKLFELAKIPLNENYSAMLLKKLLEKIRDPGKFLIPCDFPRMDVCHALADLGASINLMSLSIWKKLSLPKLTPTRMTLELADRSITRPKGVTKEVFIKVGKFHFLTDFVVVDFKADPRVPFILGRSFLMTGRALIDVYREEITLWVNDEAVTFNLNQTTRYSSTYDDMSVNRIDVIDVAREEYAQEMLGFSNNSLGGNPTSTSEPFIFESSFSLTPFEGTKVKSSIEEPPELELKDLPSHLEYAYLEGVDKLPVIIAKDLKDDEKESLLKSVGKPIHCVPKKDRIIIVENENNELIPTRLVTDQEKTTFTYPYGTFAYRRIPFGLCNAPETFQRCMMSIFYDMDEKTMEVFMEKSHFMVKKEIVLGHKISTNELEVDRAKVDVIAKLPHLTTVKETPYVFSKDCIDAFETLKKKLTEASILVVPDWNLPFKLMCDASDFAIGAVLGQPIAITLDLHTMEPEDSLRIGDEHLDTIPEKESDEFIKSSVENLVPSPSESEDEHECDVPACDDFTTFSNLLFDADDDFSSHPHHFNDESDLIESLLNQDSLIISSSKIDSLLNEFADELILLKSIPPGIDEADCDPKEEIHLIEKLLYDKSSLRPLEEFIFENSNAAIESFSPSPIPLEDSDSVRDEIDLSFTPDDSMPLGIEDDDYYSEGDIFILEELLINDSLSLPKNESFHFDIPSSPCPPAKPPDDDEIEPNSRILTVNVVGDIFEHYFPMPRLLPTQPTLASNQEKAHHLLSHRGLKAF
nr:reverse transcriptase domain-containing protein [Tanacetum cinerariifolium]